MSAADEREHLEAMLWRCGLSAVQVGMILRRADAYAGASARPAPKPRPKPEPKAPAGPPRSPAVHYSPSGDRPACLPFDPAAFHRQKALTADPSKVTCGHCLKNPAWLKAAS